jgi:hypothetical protein
VDLAPCGQRCTERQNALVITEDISGGIVATIYGHFSISPISVNLLNAFAPPTRKTKAFNSLK